MKMGEKNNIDFLKIRWYNKAVITGYGVAW